MRVFVKWVCSVTTVRLVVRSVSDYEAGDIIRRLPCEGRHHFHKECVDDWLKLMRNADVGFRMWQ